MDYMLDPEDVTDEMLQAVADASRDGSLCWHKASNRELFALCVNAWLADFVRQQNEEARSILDQHGAVQEHGCDFRWSGDEN